MYIQVVGIATGRMSKKDLVLQDGNLVIPKGCIMWLPLGCPHMSSAIYEDAHQFKPERWLESDAEYMPVSGHNHSPSTCHAQ